MMKRTEDSALRRHTNHCAPSSHNIELQVATDLILADDRSFV
jgi:hypothetical protein